MAKELSPELHGDWEKSSEEQQPTQCAWFRNGVILITVERCDIDSEEWRVTLGHSKYDPAVNDTFEHKEAALARAEELMITYKEYVNPTSYTVEIELMRDCEADLDHLLHEGGYAISENTDNSVIHTEIGVDN